MTMTLPRPWTWVLVVSLALNLFVAGAAVSWWGFHGRGPMPWGIGHFAGFGPGDEARPLMRRLWRAHREDLAPQVERLRAARRDAFDLLAGDAYTPEAFAAALERLQAESAGVQAGIHGVLVEASRDLTPEQRRRFGRSLGKHRH